MGVLSDFTVGQTVQIQDRRSATVRFLGTTNFAPGDWIGVELQDDSGKNDGSVQGKRYFQCPASRGMFIRPAAVTVTEQPKPAAPTKKTVSTAGAISKTRPSSINPAAGALRRQSVIDPATKRQSVTTASPTPIGRALPTNRNSKSPTKLVAPTASKASSTARPLAGTTSKNATTTTKPRASMAARSSMAPTTSFATAQKTSRLSTVGASKGNAGPASTAPKPASKPAFLPPGNTRARSSSASSSGSSGSNGSHVNCESCASRQSSRHPSPTRTAEVSLKSPSNEYEDGSSPASKPHSQPAKRPVNFSKPTVNSSSASRGRLPSQTQQGSVRSTSLMKENEEFKAKIRILEKKRIDDREQMKNMEKVSEERDRFQNIIAKLETKLHPQQQELSELRKRLKEAEARAEASEGSALDIDTAVEMATLDREMAEEKAEALKIELDSVKGKFEELELEVDLLREENEELSKDLSPEEKTAQGWVHMEKENERLREALMRLRDASHDQDSEMKSIVQSLEKEVDELRSYHDQLEETQERLTQSENVAETLRENLETALGAEDMIEELTEKNMSLTERIDGLKVEIEDLENLKELNEEIELAHVDTERQLQDDIDYREAMYLEEVRKNEMKDESIKDLEYTVSRFRDLVSTLQTDLQEMKASRQLSETEASELTNRTRAMMDLNMKLQSSATKTQVKAIDLELQNLQVQEITQHFDIAQPFLPDGYLTARDSINAVLRFNRIAFKANLIHGFIKERLGGVAVPGREDDMFYACEILGKLIWINAASERFIKFAEYAPLESFKKLEGALYDLEPVERALTASIDGLKQDSLKEKQCSSELDRSIAIMAHLAEVHIPEGLREYAQDIYARSRIVVAAAESAAIAVTHIKAIAQARVLLPVEADEDTEQEAEEFIRKADALVSQVRSIKVTATKIVQQLADLASRSLSLDEAALSAIEQAQDSVSGLLSACLISGMSVTALANEEGREDDLTYGEIHKAMGPSNLTLFSSLLVIAREASMEVQNFYTTACSIAQAVEFPTTLPSTPWSILAQNIKDDIRVLEATYDELAKIKDEIAEKNTTLAMKDKTIEDISHTVEILEKRVGESGSKREKVKELESTIEDKERINVGLVKRLDSMHLDLQAALRERNTYKEQAASASARDGHKTTALPAKTRQTSSAAKADIPAWREQVNSLRLTLAHSHARSNMRRNRQMEILDPQLSPSKTGRKRSYATRVIGAYPDIYSGGDPELCIERAPRLAWRRKAQKVTQTALGHTQAAGGLRDVWMEEAVRGR